MAVPTIYVPQRGVNKLQRQIMLFVQEWVRTENTPIPRQKIVKKMEEEGVKTFTTVNALNSLLRKGYLRRAQIISNKTFYVQLRKIS